LFRLAARRRDGSWPDSTDSCAKVQTSSDSPGGLSGSGGTPAGSGGPLQPSIPGLKSIAVSPASQTITLTQTGLTVGSGSATFTASGTLADGSTMDVTNLVSWQLMPSNGSVMMGATTVDGPGVYTVAAYSGAIRGNGTLTATLKADFLGGGFPQANASKFDPAPSGSQITIAYPLDGAIFPSNFGVTVQVPNPNAEDIARLSLLGDGLDVRYYAMCESGPGNGCYVTLPASFAGTYFVGASSQDDIKLTVRLASSSGSGVVESNTIGVAWAGVALSGGLYYWTTIAPGAVAGYTAPDPSDPRGTAVMRYNFAGDATKPELVWTDRGSPNTMPPFQESPPAVAGTDNATTPPQQWGEGRCVGCHAISLDGKTMAFSIGGSAASSYALLDIASTTLAVLDPTASSPTSTGLDALKKNRKGNFATFTTFGPTGTAMVTMYRGDLTLRSVPDLASQRDGLFSAATGERKTDPFWSPDGNFFAFTSYDPSQDTTTNSRFNGDTKTGGQIWVATADATGPHEDAHLIVPRASGVTSYYPAISNDGTLLAFNKSSCSGPPGVAGSYGAGPCDGYDDISASLWLTDPDGKPPVNLVHANAGDTNSNSWPRWSPDNGNFRSQRLYWLAFSSRRPYGLQINSGGGTAAKPQLWFAAVLVGGEFVTDPSAAAVWLPGQNLNQTSPTGNHVPQWVRFAVHIE
jgi:WD40-like Beta Propeller Repeat